MGILDNEMYTIMADILGLGVLILNIVGILAMVSPLLLFCLVWVGLLYFSIQHFYRHSVRELKRIEGNSFPSSVGGKVFVDRQTVVDFPLVNCCFNK